MAKWLLILICLTGHHCLAARPGMNEEPCLNGDTTATRTHGLALPRLSEVRDIMADTISQPLGKFGKYGSLLVRFVDTFDDIDSNYVERPPYDFTLMAQATSNYEFYNIGTADYARTLSFAQHPDLRAGPYFGWKWLFFGWTFDTRLLGSSRKQSTRFELSVYTSMLGFDLIHRRTGSDFYLRRVTGLGSEAKTTEGTDCEYLRTSVTGANVYYVANHTRFSNPAIYSQSTVQRRSAGSWLAGASITRHDLHFDYNALPPQLFATHEAGSIATLERVKYTDISFSVGYAYNWVPRRNWCIGIAATPALGYKRTSQRTVVLEDDDTHTSAVGRRLDQLFRRRGNVNVNATARTGIIYNNGHWFAGLFAVGHVFNYRRSDLRFTNTFGTLNICGGFYFKPSRPLTVPTAHRH